jgi:hypothetical protein
MYTFSKRSPLQESPTIIDEENKDKDSVKDLKEKETSSTKDSSSRQPRSKRSLDSKHSERLSIFGATFGGTLGKNRKPAPRSVSHSF